MSFLHFYLLGGLTLVAAPVLIHLVTREKPKHLLFPAFRFLRQKYHSNRRKLRLHHLLLLLLRMLLIALLCLALARPLLHADRVNILGFGTTNQSVAVVLLFDTSSSMEYERGGLTRLEDARRRALELLEELPPGSRVAVLDSAERGGEFLDRPGPIRERIQALTVRPANGPATRLFDRAFQMLDDLKKEYDGVSEPPPRYLFVFSDRTRPSWDPTDARSLKAREGINSVYVDVGVKEPEDLAIERVEVDPPSVPPGGTVRVRAFIRATGKRADRKVACHLDDDRVRVQEQVVQVEPGTTRAVTFEYRAAAAEGKAGEDDLKEGAHWATVRLEGTDRLPFNNQRFATFTVRKGRKVLVLVDRLWQSTPEQLKDDVLPIALRVLGFTTTVRPVAALNDIPLGEYDVVCLFQIDNAKRALWEKLLEYVEGGGKLAVVPGGSHVVADTYRLPEALKLLPGELSGPVNNDDGVEWEFAPSNKSPLMAPFLTFQRERGDVDFTKPKQHPRAFRYWKVKPREDARVVTRYRDGDHSPALLERDIKQGRVLLFTSKLDGRRDRPDLKRKERRWHNYWTNSFGLVLADICFRSLAGDNMAVEWSFICGETITLGIPAELAGATFTLSGPGLPPQGVILNVPPADDTGKAGRSLPITRAVQPGNYAVTATREGKTRPFERFSLNVRPEESQLTPQVPKEEIEQALGEGSLLPVEHNLSLREAINNKPQPIELLPWLMLLLLVFLAIENLVANRRRDTPAPEGAQPEAQARGIEARSASEGILSLALRASMWAALGAFTGGALGLLRGGYDGVLKGAVLTALLGAAHGLVVVARFGPRDGAILGALLGSFVGVLYGCVILAPAAVFGGLFGVLVGMVVGGGLMGLDGWFVGVRTQSLTPAEGRTR